jgi:hypothetical protein
MEVNVINTGLLAVLLVPLLQATSRLPAPHPDVQQTPPHLTITGGGSQFLFFHVSCVINCLTVHIVAQFPQKKSPNILQAMNDKSQFLRTDRYQTSKLFNIFITKELAKLKAAEGVVVKYIPKAHTTFDPTDNRFSVVNPGFCDSELDRELGIGKIAT